MESLTESVISLERFKINKNGGLYQRGCSYDVNLRSRIISAYQSNKNISLRNVAKECKVSVQFVLNIVDHFASTLSVFPNEKTKKTSKVLTSSVLEFLALLIREYPSSWKKHYASSLEETIDENITDEMISKALNLMKYSRKKVSKVALEKYSESNMNYYSRFLMWRMNIPSISLKFLDEVHFDRSDIGNDYGYSPVGERIQRTTFWNAGKKIESFTVTCLCGIDLNDGLFFDIKSGASDGESYFTFVSNAFKQNALKMNELLLVDNAKIHVGFSGSMVQDLLQVNNMKYYGIPTYSPELNPIELIFAKVKYDLKGQIIDENHSLLSLIIDSFKKISNDLIILNYRHCGYTNF
jgi:transposase